MVAGVGIVSPERIPSVDYTVARQHDVDCRSSFLKVHVEGSVESGNQKDGDCG